jgi:hypothetical protein
MHVDVVVVADIVVASFAATVAEQSAADMAACEWTWWWDTSYFVHIAACTHCKLQEFLCPGSAVHATFTINGESIVAHVSGMWWVFFKDSVLGKKVFRSWASNANARHKECSTAKP